MGNKILDSGDRTKFESGAVRDMHEGKGRCDLMPLDAVVYLYQYHCDNDEHETLSELFSEIHAFKEDGEIYHLGNALSKFNELRYECSISKMLLEVAKHFEDGAKKYGENNWQKGIPVRCYIDSAIRHYLKWLRGDQDEPHDRAFCWNILCCIWTCQNKPELNDYRKDEE